MMCPSDTRDLLQMLQIEGPPPELLRESYFSIESSGQPPLICSICSTVGGLA